MSTDPNGGASEPFAVLSMDQLAAYQFPPLTWILEEILPSGALVLLAGRPKVGKSLLMIDFGASVALGECFLDRATTQGPVIYVPAEEGLRLVRDRLSTRLKAERGVPFHVLPADGSLPQSLQLDDAISFGRLAATIETYRPRLLILDPFRELHHRKENDADEMAALLRPLRQLAHETDTLIMLNHHRNKYALDPALSSRGSSAITGSVDIVVSLELADESDDAGLTPDQVLTLRIAGRYGPRQRLEARLRSGLRWEASTPRGYDPLPIIERVVRELQTRGDALTAEELAEATKASKQRVQGALRDLVAGGRIQRSGAGTRFQPYRYSSGRTSSAHEEFRDQTRKRDGGCPQPGIYTPPERGHDKNRDQTRNPKNGPDGGGHDKSSRCSACWGSEWWWRSDGSGPVCRVCHPPPADYDC